MFLIEGEICTSCNCGQIVMVPVSGCTCFLGKPPCGACESPAWLKSDFCDAREAVERPSLTEHEINEIVRKALGHDKIEQQAK